MKKAAAVHTTKSESRQATATKDEDPISTKPVNMKRVRENITNMVGNSAEEVAKALIDAAKKGEVGAARYLFDAVGLYPAGDENEQPKEDSLAYSLLKQLGLPTEPVIGDEDVAGRERPGSGERAGRD